MEDSTAEDGVGLHGQYLLNTFMVIFPTRQPETNTVTSPGYITSPAPCGQFQWPLCSIPQVSDLPRGTRGRGGAGSVSRTGIPTPEKEVPSTAPHSSVQEEILKLAGQDGGLPKRVRHLLQAGWSPSCLLFNSWCCVCHSLVLVRVTRVVGITTEETRVSFALISTTTRYGCQQVWLHLGRELQPCEESCGREGRRAHGQQWPNFNRTRICCPNRTVCDGTRAPHWVTGWWPQCFCREVSAQDDKASVAV